MLCDVGGRTLDEVVRRTMKFVMANDLARQFNVFGRFGKRPLGPTTLFSIIYSEL